MPAYGTKTLLVFLFASAVSFAEPALVLDFEGGDELSDYGTFEKGVFLATPGYGGSTRCIAQRANGIYANIAYTLPRPITLAPGSTLRFAHRVVTEGKAKYVGIYILTSSGKLTITNVPTGAEWKVDEIKLLGMRPDEKSGVNEPLAAGDAVTKITLYGRLREPADQTTYVNDIVLSVPGAVPMSVSSASKPSPEKAVHFDPGPSLPPLHEGELFNYDFEGASTTDYAQFKGGAILSPGYESPHAWSVSGNAQFLRMEFPCDFVLRDDMYLEADTKVVTQTGSRLYIGLYLYRDDGKKALISNMASTAEWEQNSSRKILFWGVDDKSQVKDRPQIGERYTRCALYSKLAGGTPQNLIVDNLKLVWEGGSALIAPHGNAFRATHAKDRDHVLS